MGGFALLIIGLVFLIQDLVPQFLYGVPPSLALVVGDSAIGLAGLAVIVIGKALGLLEARLAKLEAATSESLPKG